MFRPLRPRQIVIDVSIAVGFALLVGVAYGFTFSMVALGGMATALALRRLSPPLALGLVWVTALIQVFFDIGPDPLNLAILPVLYATASYGRPFLKWAGLVSSFAGAFLMSVYVWWQLFIYFAESPDSVPNLSYAIPIFVFIFFLSSAAFALSWTLGLLAKIWRTSRESNQARILAERARIDAQQSVVVEQERNRIARDMHDVVAHSLAVVIAQADGARYARDTDPSAVDVALANISATAREALGDVRILLGQLRYSQTDAPQPVLADLDRLYGQLRSAGLALLVEASGAPAPLPGGVQLAVYRIVQEALTNALRHGATDGDSTVRFTWQPESLHIEISNPIDPEAVAAAARDESATASGHGLAGMTERATLVGGRIGATANGAQFVVEVTIPVTQSEVPA